jgi:peptidoglycan/LPS O-acetylase OafA/YrhL
MSSTSARGAFRHTAASVSLDATRGAAALLVLFDHCHNLFFVGFGTALRTAAHFYPTLVIYVVGSAGQEAVVIFFVLSGYLISGSVLRSLERGRWSWKDYLEHRLVRLWLVLIPALVLCAAWDCARLAMNPGVGGDGTFIARLAATHITWKIFFGNVFFQQAVHLTTFGSDKVLWSLSNEFWYYILFPLGLLALRRGELKTRIRSGVGFLVVAMLLTKGLLALFPVWLCGAGLAMVKPPRVGAMIRWLSFVIYMTCVFALAATPWPWHYFKMDYVLAVLTAVFLWVMLSAERQIDETAMVVRATRSLAGFSYSLYLVHYPLLAFFAALLTRGGNWTLTPRTLAKGTGLCALAIIYSYGVACVTEFKNERVRRWVDARLGAFI